MVLLSSTDGASFVQASVTSELYSTTFTWTEIAVSNQDCSTVVSFRAFIDERVFERFEWCNEWTWTTEKTYS